MTCLECSKELSYMDHKKAMESLGLELCTKHQHRIERLMRSNKSHIEAVQLYYGLKQVGVTAMLEWWDGNKFIDLAIARVKLNIIIDAEYHMITDEQAINDLQKAMYSFENGFTTIRIPHVLIKHYLKETVHNLLGIMEGLKAGVKVI